MPSTDHIHGENQSIDVYDQVLTTRKQAFIDWVKEHPAIIALTADECDWDEAYMWWFEKIETNMTPSTKTFAEYLETEV